MSQILKPYEELAIASDRKIFFHIRLKLTAVYLAIITSILLVSNTFNYLDLQHDINEAKNYMRTDVKFETVFGHAASLDMLIKEMIVEDILVLAVAAWISYFFAGFTLKPVQRALIVQKTFSENASHELRTPLAIIKSDIEVLLRNRHRSEGDVTSTLESVVEEIDRMSTMTNDLLLLSRFEHQRSTVQEPLNLAEVTGNVVKKMTLLAHEKSIDMKFISSNPVITFNAGDIFALERALFNLIQNAITYTPKDGSITVTLKEEKRSILLTIIDTGCGIKHKDLPHVFERFYKGATSEGTGLGLPIVKEIIENHRGKITIKSKEGEGTEVILRFSVSKLNRFNNA